MLHRLEMAQGYVPPVPELVDLHIPSTCKEIFPTWVDAEEKLTELVDGSTYRVTIFPISDNFYNISLMIPPAALVIPEEYKPVVEWILNDVASEYFPSHGILKPYIKNLHNFRNLIDLKVRITEHLLQWKFSGQPTLKESLRRAFGLGLMRSVSVECKITCDGEQFEKK